MSSKNRNNNQNQNKPGNADELEKNNQTTQAPEESAESNTGEDKQSDEASETHASDASQSGDSGTSDPAIDASDDNSSSAASVDTSQLSARQAAKAKLLKETVASGDGSAMRDSLPDDPDKLKDMVVNLDKGKNQIAQRLTEAEAQMRINKPKLDRIALVESALKAAAKSAETEVRPVEGNYILGHGLVPDKVMLLTPVGKYHASTRMSVMVCYADVVRGEVDGEEVEAYTNFTNLVERHNTMIGESQDKSAWILKN